MTTIDYVAQPTHRSTLDVIDGVLTTPGVERIDVAAAYVTSGGADVLLKVLDRRTGANNANVIKRWITSFDYCRTEPIALEALLALPSSTVRIHDAQTCLKNRGVPRIPFHPKTFQFHTPSSDYILAGSGNISRSGLSRGYETGLLVGIDRSTPPLIPTAVTAIDTLQQAFVSVWERATPLSSKLLAAYSSLYESSEHLNNAVPTEDDIATSDTSSGSLSSDDLKKLRICRSFWIEAGNITKNRGPHLPGNQLMMKRLSRRFFGFEPTSVAENTSIGSVAISFNNGPLENYSLTYSDNKMDKLVLPMPGAEGPAFYDGCYLLFERLKAFRFRLSLGTGADKMIWSKKSKLINGAFKMASGREWGVF